MKTILLTTLVLVSHVAATAGEFWYASHPSICESEAAPGYKICLHHSDVLRIFMGDGKIDAEVQCVDAALALGLKDECTLH